MRHYIGYIGGMALTAALLSGCSSQRPVGAVRVTPAEQRLIADAETGEARLQAGFSLPEGYLSKRGRLVIAPRLVEGDNLLAEFRPIVIEGAVYGKKSDRRRTLEGVEDQYSSLATRVSDAEAARELPFEATVVLPEGTDSGELVALLSWDGCAECSAIDTLRVADVSRRVVPRYMLRWMEPNITLRPKVIEGDGEAHLRFLIDRAEIDPSLGNNSSELKGLSDGLAVLFKDSLATMNSLTITGMASADGSTEYNLRLAHQRAESARDWLVRELGLSAGTGGRIAIDARPEGWEPVLRLMEKDGHPDAAKVRAILQRIPDSEEDRQERAIRALPCWRDIKERYLATDRNVAYSYSYTLKSFTTEGELRKAWRERPDALSEEEWLRLASLMVSDGEKREVYEAMTVHFPASEVAINNLAVICLREGKEAEARSWLCRVPRWCGELDGKRLTLEE